MPDAAGRQERHDFRRRPRHTLHYGPGGRRRASAEHEDGLLTIRPCVEVQDRLERLAPDDERIHRGHELIVAVGFATAGREPIEVTVGTSDETIDARANKDRRSHYSLLMLRPNARHHPRPRTSYM